MGTPSPITIDADGSSQDPGIYSGDLGQTGLVVHSAEATFAPSVAEASGLVELTATDAVVDVTSGSFSPNARDAGGFSSAGLGGGIDYDTGFAPVSSSSLGGGVLSWGRGGGAYSVNALATNWTADVGVSFDIGNTPAQGLDISGGLAATTRASQSSAVNAGSARSDAAALDSPAIVSDYPVDTGRQSSARHVDDNKADADDFASRSLQPLSADRDLSVQLDLTAETRDMRADNGSVSIRATNGNDASVAQDYAIDLDEDATDTANNDAVPVVGAGLDLDALSTLDTAPNKDDAPGLIIAEGNESVVAQPAIATGFDFSTDSGTKSTGVVTSRSLASKSMASATGAETLSDLDSGLVADAGSADMTSTEADSLNFGVPDYVDTNLDAGLVESSGVTKSRSGGLSYDYTANLDQAPGYGFGGLGAGASNDNSRIGGYLDYAASYNNVSGSLDYISSYDYSAKGYVDYVASYEDLGGAIDQGAFGSTDTALTSLDTVSSYDYGGNWDLAAGFDTDATVLDATLNIGGFDSGVGSWG